jgi:ribonucleoside-triphosphate reductase
MVANEDAYQENNASPYYTNSSHLPVDYTDDIFELLDLQDDLQTKYTGGTVIHLFVGEEITDITAVKKLVRTICENYHLPYFTITPTFSVCPNHGYIAGKVEVCAKCGSANEIWSRIVGYIRPIQQWNSGKRAEFNDRNTYKIEIKEKKAELPEVQNTAMEFVEDVPMKIADSVAGPVLVEVEATEQTALV